MSIETKEHGTRLPLGDILLSAIASVSWALIGMAGTAALGLHLLQADSTASLGPMTAAVVALGAGGSVTPSGDASAFGLTGAQATTAIEITPLGVSLVGGLLLAWFFLRSLRGAQVVIAPSELLARAGAVVALFVAMLGGLAWAGHDVITIDGSSLELDDLPGGDGGGGIELPGLGDIGDIGGLLPDRIGGLVDAKAAVGFTVDTAPTLLGGLGWSAGVLLVALLASRRTPLPRGWEAVHRVVRPAVSALVTVLLVAVAAGFAAAAYAAIGDDHPERIAGAALLGAPNGVWLGIPLSLFVPWDGRATGELTRFLPDPLDDLLGSGSSESVTLGRLAELDGRVWLLAVATALMMLLAGVLVAVRTPVGAAGVESVSAGVRGSGALGLAGRCAVRLGVATALTLPLLAWLTEVSVNASLSVLGFDAFGAGIDLRGQLGMALLLGAVWGAAAGAVGALLARATGAVGRRASPLARLALGDVAGVRGAGAPGAESAGGASHGAASAGSYAPGSARPYGGPTGPYGGESARPYGAEAGARYGDESGVRSSPEAGGSYAGESGRPYGLEGGARYADESGARSSPEAGGSYAGEPGHPYGGEGGQPYGGEAGRSYGAEPGQPYEPGLSHGAEPGQPYAAEPGPSHGAGPGDPHAAGAGRHHSGAAEGPYSPGSPYRPPNPATNPYLRAPDESREPEDAPPPGNDMYGAPTVVRPIGTPARSPRKPPEPRSGDRPASTSNDGPPPPPPPPPPAPPGRPKGRR